MALPGSLIWKVLLVFNIPASAGAVNGVFDADSFIVSHPFQNLNVLKFQCI
jgi:hypothetical protein